MYDADGGASFGARGRVPVKVPAYSEVKSENRFSPTDHAPPCPEPCPESVFNDWFNII